MHASTTHTPFNVNGLRHPRIPSLIQSESGLRRGGTCSSKKCFGSCSSRITAHVDTFDADVDNVDNNEVDHSSSDDASALPNSGDDTDKFSIVNDHTIKGVDTIADEEKDLQAVRSKRTERNSNESAENFLLT